MWDVLSKGERTYNPIEHVRQDNVYQVDQDSGPEDPYLWIAPYPSVSLGDIAEVFHARDVIEAAKAAIVTNAIAPYTDIKNQHFDQSKSLASVKGLFRSSLLPHEVTIDRDPFDTEFSVWFLLADVLSYKRLAKSAFRVVTGNRNKPTALGDIALAVRQRGMTPEETAKQFHDRHLGLRFGILPLIEDVRKFVSTINTWSDKYKQSSTLSDKRYRSFNKEDCKRWSLFQPTEELVTLQMGNNTFPITVKVKQTYEVTWRGLSLYGFSCPEFSGWVSRMKQMVDSFGILDPSALWDIVPFSFIVDWILSVSSFLHKNRPRLFPATAVIHDYMESFRIVTNVRYTAEWQQPIFGEHASIHEATAYRPVFIGSEQYTTYCRQRFLPVVSMFKMGRGTPRRGGALALDKIAIAASIIGQRAHMPKWERGNAY
jgi:hypothetical protein